MVNFIFMLTHHDVTIPNAVEVFKQTRDTGVKYVGFKDVGLSIKKDARSCESNEKRRKESIL